MWFFVEFVEVREFHEYITYFLYAAYIIQRPDLKHIRMSLNVRTLFGLSIHYLVYVYTIWFKHILSM